MVSPPILERPPVYWTEGACATVMLVLGIDTAVMFGAALAPYGG
jgi:hypothetical protein